MVAKLLALLLAPQPSSDADNAEPEPDADAKALRDEIQKLHDFCSLPHSSQMADAMVCAPCIEDADAKCLRGECGCGFKALWTKGLRKRLVYANGTLKPGISRVWLTKMQWDRIKSGGDGSSSEDELRQQCEGTLIECLDAFEPIQDTMTPHRFDIGHVKVRTPSLPPSHTDRHRRTPLSPIPSQVAARECDQHTVLGMIKDDSDYSENGEIKKKDAMQREYWTIVYYTLKISISSFLVSAAWKDRRGPLPKGAEVTVEADDGTDTTYFAIVVRGSTDAGEAVAYEVERPSGERATVRRELLRHRRWHRIGFLQFSNDKQHDGWQSQAWFARRHRFFQLWNDEGREAALAFARDDAADRARAEQQAALDAKAAAMAADVAAAKASVTAAEQAAADGEDEEDADEQAARRAAAADATAAALAAAIAAAAAKPSAYAVPVPRAARRHPTDAEFNEWMAHLDEEKFWAWVGHADNAVHFKSKEMLYWWSTRLDKVAFMKAIWIEFGCPGHGMQVPTESMTCAYLHHAK